jgi:hypothetical protein
MRYEQREEGPAARSVGVLVLAYSGWVVGFEVRWRPPRRRRAREEWAYRRIVLLITAGEGATDGGAAGTVFVLIG